MELNSMWTCAFFKNVNINIMCSAPALTWLRINKDKGCSTSPEKTDWDDSVATKCFYSITCLERPPGSPLATKMWSVKTSGLWWQVQLYWNVGPAAENVWSVQTGGLSWQWSLKIGFTVPLTMYLHHVHRPKFLSSTVIQCIRWCIQICANSAKGSCLHTTVSSESSSVTLFRT